MKPRHLFITLGSSFLAFLMLKNVIDHLSDWPKPLTDFVGFGYKDGLKSNPMDGNMV